MSFLKRPFCSLVSLTALGLCTSFWKNCSVHPIHLVKVTHESYFIITSKWAPRGGDMSKCFECDFANWNLTNKNRVAPAVPMQNIAFIAWEQCLGRTVSCYANIHFIKTMSLGYSSWTNPTNAHITFSYAENTLMCKLRFEREHLSIASPLCFQFLPLFLLIVLYHFPKEYHLFICHLYHFISTMQYY